MTVSTEKAPANFVPAAAVIRRVQALFGIIGRKAYVGGLISQLLKPRAQQIVAGGIVALAVMDRLDVDEVEICPWALREGIVLRRLDWLQD